MHKNPLVVKVRPVETRLDDYLEQDNSYRIGITKDADGKHTATVNVNGHVFTAVHADRLKAASAVQKIADKAIDDGLTVHTKE